MFFLAIRKFSPVPCVNSAMIALLLAATCLSAPACSKEPADPVVHTYTVRGEIVSLPDPANPASELRIHHEAIEDFKNNKGESDPMHAMTMTFPPAEDVSLDDLAVGDKVQFVFRVQWAPSYEMGATAIKKLPADTELIFDESDDHGHHH